MPMGSKVAPVEVVCRECKKQWMMIPSDYRARLKKSKNGELFCSMNCSGAYRKRLKALGREVLAKAENDATDENQQRVMERR